MVWGARGNLNPLGTSPWCNYNPEFGFGVYDSSAYLLYLNTSVNYGTKMFLNFIWTVYYCIIVSAVYFFTHHIAELYPRWYLKYVIFRTKALLLVTLHVCSEEVISCDCSWVGVAGGFAFFPSSRGEMQASGGPDTPLWARAHLAHRWTWRSCLSCCGSNAGTCVSVHMPSCSPGAYWGVGLLAFTH